MTNRLALILGGMILGGLIIDIAIFGTGHALFLAKKMADLIEWLAFWR